VTAALSLAFVLGFAGGLFAGIGAAIVALWGRET